MIPNELQYQVHVGDSKAFQTLFSLCGKDVYLLSFKMLGNVEEARAAVKRIFLSLQHELIESPGPIDVDARLAALTREELLRSMAAQVVAAPDGLPLTWADCNIGVSIATPPQAAVPAPVPVSPSKKDPPVPSVEEPPAHPGPQRNRRGPALLWIAVVLLAALLGWFLLDVLMKLQLIPRVDLGYTWFNEHIFRLFSQT